MEHVEPRAAGRPSDGTSRAPSRIAAGLGWGSAYALYAAAYTSAIRASLGVSLGAALLGGLANTLPEAIAAPLVLRAVARSGRATEPAGAGPASALRLALLAVLFVLWSVAGAVLGLTALRAWETGTWRLSVDSRNVVWKALFSLLVFGALAGVGLARFQARRANEASERAIRSEALRAQARLAILRAQLNPHFILNVLHSLVGLAERDPRATSLALERLGATLRYALRVQRRGDDRVALGDELAFTREYLELERLRLGERLETRFRVDDALLSRVVPPFVLQPLVENAVLHAVAPRARGGVVAVRIEEDADAVLVAVEDDGAAVAGAPRDVPSPGSGLGLALLRDRLDALYGGRATLTLDRSALGGVRATLRLVGEPMPEDGDAG